MIVLGIETSCDDTSAAVLKGEKLLSNVISTQLIHKQFGGVVPELASRAHTEFILPVLKQALEQSGIKKKDIQGIAVTCGPGLVGSILVGLCTAKGLAHALKVPIAGINHLEGHIWANRLAHEAVDPPFVVLIVSGGHTQTVYVKKWGEYEVLGRTRDDAAGEAFDKVGKLLGLGYPGGPEIEKRAQNGDLNYVRFPRAYLESGSLDYSFSGLKTAVLNHVHDIGDKQTQEHLPDIAACFQDAVIDILTEKTIMAAQLKMVSTICLAGGVAVNQTLRDRMTKRCREEKVSVVWPSPALCTDNGGMIAAAGQFYLLNHKGFSMPLVPMPSLNL